jgi:alkanesulfonate monooxygenase SsuD/methylene tetrahydromethanopterin reductase-like flavin-dependent oxidoreductase (luciferase family)
VTLLQTKASRNLPSAFSAAADTADPQVLAELAHIAQESGRDGVFLEDYILHHSGREVPTCDPWVALAAMALVTSRVRLGTEVTALPRRRPWKLAREVVTLDHLSNGRMILGVGLGDTNDPGFGAVEEPVDATTCAQLVDESLAIIEGLWTGKPLSFSGSHYEIAELTLRPMPLQRPRGPSGWAEDGRTQDSSVALCSSMASAPISRPTPTDGSITALSSSRKSKDFVVQHRGSSQGYDIVTGGRRREDDWERERDLIASLDEAGATWWVEYAPAPFDLDTQRQVAERGPLQP